MQFAKPRTRLDCQLIKRQVVDRHRKRFAEVPPRQCVRRSGPLPRVDQVKAHPRRNSRPRHIERRPAPRSHYASGPTPSDSRSFNACTPIETRLTPAVAVAAEPPGLNAGRVGLQRDLGARRQAPSAHPIRSMIAATVSGGIRLGVPPPKNTVSTVRVCRTSACGGRQISASNASPPAILIHGRARHGS